MSYNFLYLAQYLLLMAVPVLVSFISIIIWDSLYIKIVGLVVGPILYFISFPICAGILSRLGLSGIVDGKYERSTQNKIYKKRKLHTGPWTFLFYFKPVYYIVLSIPLLKKITFRLFGYKGSLDFVVYPDTWLRDLPLLNIASGVYLSNKSSIATNICLSNGDIIVNGITIGEGSTVGHASIVGPGTKMGKKTDIEASVTSGIRVTYGDNVKIGELCGIQHGVKIDDNVIIEAVSTIGLRCRIGPNIRIKEGSHIHTGVRLHNQDEADKYYSEETGAMTLTRIKALKKYSSVSNDEVKAILNLDEKRT